MSGTWMSLCPESERTTMLSVLNTVEKGARCEFMGSASELRASMLASKPGEKGALVGLTTSGVSDINLAAAIAADGRAKRVVLVRRSPSGSLRSRAARAGIDLVVNPDDLPNVAEPVGVSTRAEEKSCVSTWGYVTEKPARVAPPERHSPIISFCSGRGGVGKTSIVSCAAACAASWGMHVEAVDLDLSCGNLFSTFGLARAADLSRLDPSALEDDLERFGVEAAPGIRVWGPCERPESSELALPVVAALISKLSTTSDLVLVDTSPTFTEAVATAAQMSDRVVLVFDQRPGSLASLARTSGLAVRLGVARTRIARLENRANPKSKLDLSFGRAEVGLEAARAFRTFDGGNEVADFLSAGEVTNLVELGSPFTNSVATCISQLLEELGTLPDVEAAKNSAAGGHDRRRRLFGGKREVS